MKKKIRVVQHKRLPNGDLGYYLNGEIHILNPEAMYRHVLRHEIAHSKNSSLANLADLFIGSVSNPLTRAGMFLLLASFIGYIVFRLIAPWGPMLIVSVVTSAVILVFIGQGFYWLEEYRAEQVAKHGRPRPKIEKKAKAPDGSQNQVSAIVLGSTETVRTGQDPVPDP